MFDKTEVLEEYIELKRTVKEAEERMDELKDVIKSFMEVDQVTPVISGATVSCVKGKAKYIYSPETTAKEKELKAIMKVDVKTGIAEIEYGEAYLKVNFEKE